MSEDTITLLPMNPGRIYFLDFGDVQIIGRYRRCTIPDWYFWEYLHYYGGEESFVPYKYFPQEGIMSIRDASNAEKHALLKQAILHNTI